MAVYLVRHAHAGDRSGWPGDDTERPLTDEGQGQAAGLDQLLERAEVALVASSPYVRCIQTVEPVARRRGLDVAVTSRLAEGADVGPLIDWLLERADDGIVACSHGDVIPKVLRALTAEGLGGDGGAESRKGSVWVLETDGARFTSGAYHPPLRA